MSKLQKVTLSILCLLLLVSVFLFSKLTTSKKYYSSDKQYSVYTKTYVYSEIACGLFSTFECSFAGRVYLFDEIEKENISSIYIKNTKSIETLSWSNIDNTIYFKDSSIEIPEGEFILPRPFIKIQH